MIKKLIIWIFVFILTISQVLGFTDGWNFTRYSFNKTQEGAYLVDDCNEMNYDNWNSSTMVSFAISSSKCEWAGTDTLVYANVNHSVNLLYGAAATADDWDRIISGANQDHMFGFSNRTYGVYFGNAYSTGDYFGLTGDGNRYHSYFKTGTSVGAPGTYADYEPFFNITYTDYYMEYDTGFSSRTESSRGMNSSTDSLYIGMGTYNAADANTATWNMDNIRYYPIPYLALVNFSVVSSGVGQPNYNVSFYNASTMTMIDSAITDADGLAQLNLSKGPTVQRFPYDIVVTILNGGSVELNETVYAKEVQGIYPHDVYEYDIGEATPYYSSLTLNSPADNAHNNSFVNNFCYTPNWNSSITACELYTNETGSFVSEELSVGITNGSLNCFNHNIAVDGYYLWNVLCWGGATEFAASNRTFIIDTDDPDITINDAVNNSKHSNTDYLVIDFVCSDEYVYDMEYIIYNSTDTNKSYAYNYTLGNNTLKLWRNISLATFGDSNYTVNYSCSDSHTDKTWDVLLEEEIITDGIIIDIDRKDKIEIKIKDIVGGKFLDLNTLKLKDRLIFNLNFDTPITGFTYEIKANSYKTYNSEFEGHIILNNKYWFDTEPYETTNIEEKNGKIYVTVSVPNKDKISTESLGGLNIVTLQSTFSVDSTEPVFSDLGSNTTTPLTERDLLMFGTITDNFPDSYRFAWNSSGSWVNITSPAAYTSGQNVTLAREVNITGYQCFQMWANDTHGNAAVSSAQCFNVTAYKAHISIYNEGSGALITTTNVTVKFSSIHGEYTAITDTGTLIYDLNQSAEYSVLFTAEGYSPRTYTITVGNTSIEYLNAYLTQNTSNTIFTIIDSDTSEVVPDVLCTMYRTINGSWQAVESKYSDITGRVQFTYEGNINYRFFLSKSDYEDYTFNLNPILFSSYDVEMSRSTLINYTQDFDEISFLYSPQTFENGEVTTFNFIIASPNGLLTGYGIELTYPGGTSSASGAAALGSQLSVDLNITGADVFDRVRLDYYYITDLSGGRNYTAYFPIMINTTPRTWLHNKEEDYGLGIFERILVVTIIVLFVVGIATLIGQPIAGFALGLMVLGFMVMIGFVPLWIVLPSILIGIFFLMWKSGGF